MKRIKLFSWENERKSIKDIKSIGEDFFYLDKVSSELISGEPFKSNVLTAILCSKGTTKGKFNLKPFTTAAPCLIVILTDQILEYEEISEDFEGSAIVLTKRFLENLDLEERFSSYVSVLDNPFMVLTDAGLDAMETYYRMIRKTVITEGNPNRLEIVRLLTKAFFYGVGPSLHQNSKNIKKSKNEMLVDTFLQLVKNNYKKHRGLDFYAEKLCLTPKYVSAVIKQASGTAASDWIDQYVLLEAKALLKSTNMTIQQIADELNFPNQSFFGKYFKRLVGISPKEYRSR